MAPKNIEKFYINWKSGLDAFLSGYIYDTAENLNRTRFAYLRLQYYLTQLLNDSLEDINKIVLLPGIRGVGKTTLLAQLYYFEKYISPTKSSVLAINAKKLNHRVYISADKLFMEGISLNDYFKFLENNIFGNFSSVNEKILILIDEIQYDEKWSLFLKLLHDKIKGHKNILIIVTGSSALSLNQKNTDLIRRSTTEKIFPLKFTDYLLLQHKTFLHKGLSQKLKQAILFSSTASESYAQLKEMEKETLIFWGDLTNAENIKKQYFEQGAFPFSMSINNRTLALNRIKDMILTNIVQKDLLNISGFSSETLVKIPNLLYLLASSDEISTGKLGSALNLDAHTLNKILDALTRTEILFEVLPYGRPYSQVKKSSKYLFITSNIRMGLLDGIFNVDIKGKLLEDYCALIFAKELTDKAKIHYDYASGGADFIARFKDNREIVIEVGFGKEKINQVENTLKKTEGRGIYGLVIGSEKLELVNENIVKIPLEYFLLM